LDPKTIENLVKDFGSQGSQMIVEEPYKDNYNFRVMIESTNFTDLIKEKTAQIEQNMRVSSPSRGIDMSLIEQIK
jgi:hypothetical protein